MLILTVVLICISCDMECAHKDMSATVIQSSCGSRGYTVFKCNDCSYSFESDFVEPLPHDLESTLTEPTCTSSGYTLHECKNCDYSYISDNVSALGHSLDITILSPTCTKPGYTAVQCKRENCGYSLTKDYTQPVEHSFTSELTPATCLKEGYTTYTCSVCDYSYISEIVSATAHEFTSVITAPTCLEQGYTTKTCSLCQEEFITDYTEPVGHTYTSSIFKATSSRDGYTQNDCDRCDYSYRSNVVYSYSVFMGAYTAKDKPLAKGIDVSTYNGTLKWQNIASQGIDFAIIRAGSSVSGQDAQFDYNYRNAKAAGLDVGAYYYVDVKTVEDILKCAEDLKLLLEGKKFEYPIYLDIEKDSLGEELGKELLTEMCVAFIETLQADGYFAALYTNNNWLVNFFDTEKVTSLYDVWYARYIPTADIASPVWNLEKYGTTMGMWQYTEEGRLENETCNFDFNIAYRDYPTIIKRFGYNGF